MSTPLRDLITSLASDPRSQAEFAADPARFLGDHGWGDLDGQDIGTALGALADESSIEHATRLGEIAGGDGHGDGLGGAITALEAAASALGEDARVAGGADVDPDLVLDHPGDGTALGDLDVAEGDPSSDIDGAAAEAPDDDVDVDDLDDIGDVDDLRATGDPDDELDGRLFRSPAAGSNGEEPDDDLDRARFGAADESGDEPEPDVPPVADADVPEGPDVPDAPGADVPLGDDPLAAHDPPDEPEPWSGEAEGSAPAGGTTDDDDPDDL
jgi:hypothetical protein